MADHADLFAEARRVIPGGVNSPVRAFQAVGGVPLFIERAEGAYVYAADGRRLIDYVGSWGPMILGHAHPKVIEAVVRAAADGLSFGAPTEAETALAGLICQRLPWLERVRMVNSGTEAVMSAIRLARAATGRDGLIKFAGCYHGHADSLLVQAGSGALTLGVPNSPGVPADFVKHTLVAQYNDADSVAALLDKHKGEIAAVLVEPVAGNMNCVPPVPGFLEALRELCDAHGCLLIMDEVMSGFRVHPQGAQGLYQVFGDLTVLGKIIGGGMPVGAFGGAARLMEQLAPEGAVYQAGTLSGNPVAMAAGRATLEALTAEVYAGLEERSEALIRGIRAAAADAGVPLQTNRVGSMFGLFFSRDDAPVTRFEQVQACDTQGFARFFHACLEQDVYLAPSAFEAGFVSAAHGAAEIERTIAAAGQAFTRGSA